MDFRLPATVTRDTAWAAFHGGARWLDGDLEFQIENGFWAPGAMTDKQVTSCRLTVRTGSYILDEAKNGNAYDWSAMPADTVWRMTMRLGLHSSRLGDRSMLLAALATLHWGRQ